MATTEVTICNDALLMLGAEVITSLAQDSKEANLCNVLYEKARDQLLSAHPWNFAVTRVEIAADADLPSGWDDGEWASAFTLPSDCLRVLGLDDPDEAWAKEGSKLFANYAPIFAKYIKKVTDVTLFPAYFERALALELAVKMCYALTESATTLAEIIKLKNDAVSEARSFDAQEGSTLTVQATDFRNSRY